MKTRFEDLTDHALTARLYDIRGQERALVVEFLHLLNEIERRRTVLVLGFSSTFAFCVEHLGLSKGTAYRRITCARLVARFPVLAEYLADGRLSCRTLVVLREVLDEERIGEILDRAAGRSEEQVKELAAALRPRPEPAEMLRRLPSSTPRQGVLALEVPVSIGSRVEQIVEFHQVAPPVVEAPVPVPAPAVVRACVEERRGTVEPIAEDRYVLRVTVSRELKADLEAVRDALSHKLPGASLEAVLHECVRVTLASCAKRRRGAGRAPARPAKPRGGSRDIPAAVRNAVWARDAGRCTFVGATGRRCGSRHQLEVHHLHPFGKQGPATVDNLTLRCRAHNRLAAEQDYGRAQVAAKIARRRGAREPVAGYGWLAAQNASGAISESQSKVSVASPDAAVMRTSSTVAMVGRSGVSGASEPRVRKTSIGSSASGPSSISSKVLVGSPIDSRLALARANTRPLTRRRWKVPTSSEPAPPTESPMPAGPA